MTLREWGAAGGVPLVFWPGLNPWGALQLVEVGPLLAARGFHVRAVEPPWDLEPDGYLPSRLADRVAAELDGRFVFMGHSWGGTVGAHLAARHPERVRGLVLLDGGHVDYPLESSRDELAAQFEAEQAGFGFDSWDDFRAWVGERNWERYRTGMVERHGRIVPGSGPRAAAWARWGVAAEPATSVHERIECPVLLLLSRDGERGALSAETHRLDAGHDLAADRPEETARLVADWVATLPR